MKDNEIRKLAGNPDAIPAQYIEWFLKGFRECEVQQVKNLNLPNVRERLINYIDTRINYFSDGDEIKSMIESIRDEIFVKELKEMKKIINDNNF